VLDLHVRSGEPYSDTLTNLVVDYDYALNVVYYHKTVSYCCWRPRAFGNQFKTCRGKFVHAMVPKQGWILL
jgi:hypothetical protein